MYEAIDGKSFQTNWRCKLHNSILKSNGRSTIKQNIRLLKNKPEKVDGNEETAKKLIELLSKVPDDQAWLVAKAMAGLSVDRAIEALNSMKPPNSRIKP
mgnify:CR=1 FL=1